MLHLNSMATQKSELRHIQPSCMLFSAQCNYPCAVCIQNQVPCSKSEYFPFYSSSAQHWSKNAFVFQKIQNKNTSDLLNRNQFIRPNRFSFYVPHPLSRYPQLGMANVITRQQTQKQHTQKTHNLSER